MLRVTLAHTILDMVGAPTLPVREGDVLADKYRIERVLGSGGMGVVAAATHVTLGQTVAVKFLLSDGTDPKAVARFLREARATVQLQSEHAARVSDVGKLEGGAPFMVMEYLHGRDSAAEIAETGALSPSVATDYLLQACDAVAEAHSLGIVHRDLKPANLYLTQRRDGSPLVKVLDFGISKFQDPTRHGMAQASLTSTQALVGSPLYMSPEQVRNAKRVDHRTDVWSLGAILFELLTATPPFRGETLGEIFSKILSDPAPLLRSLAPETPAELEQIVARALEKDPDHRFSGVGELSRALRPFAPESARVLADRISRMDRSPASSLEPSPPLASREVPVLAARTASDWSQTQPMGKRNLVRNWVLGGAAASLVSALAIVGFLKLRPSHVEEAPMDSPPVTAAAEVTISSEVPAEQVPSVTIASAGPVPSAAKSEAPVKRSPPARAPTLPPKPKVETPPHPAAAKASSSAKPPETSPAGLPSALKSGGRK